MRTGTVPYARKKNPHAELTLPESKKTRLSSQLKKTLPHCFSASQRQAVIPLAAWTWVWHNKNLTHASFFASRWQAVIPLKSGIQKAAIRQTTFIALTGFRFSAEWPITHRLTGIRENRDGPICKEEKSSCRTHVAWKQKDQIVFPTKENTTALLFCISAASRHSSCCMNVSLT